MTIGERIRKRQHEILSDYCKKCLGICCNGQRHIIRVNPGSLPLFQEAGIPLFKQRELKKSSLKYWEKHPDKKLFFKDGSEVPKPAIISWGNLFRGYYQGLYSNICPFYSGEIGCGVYNDPRRPTDCKDYPISIFPESNESSGAYLDIRVMESCPNRGDLILELAKDFPIRIIK